MSRQDYQRDSISAAETPSEIRPGLDMQRAQLAHAWTFLLLLGVASATIALICLLWKRVLDVPLQQSAIQLPISTCLVIISWHHLKSELAERGKLLLTWPDTRFALSPGATKAGSWLCFLISCFALLQAELVFVTLFAWAGFELARMNHRSQQPVRVYDLGFSRHGDFVRWDAIDRSTWAEDEEGESIFWYQVRRPVPLFHVGTLPVPVDVRDEFMGTLGK